MKKGGAKQKIIACGLALVSMATLASMATSYAWYRENSVSTLEDLFITTKGSSLQLGYRREGDLIFPDQLSEKDCLFMDPHFRENQLLQDLSGMYSKTWLNEETDPSLAWPVLYQLNEKETKHGTRFLPAENHFLQFELFVRSSDPCHLYLHESSFMRNASEDADLVSCARISFLTAEGYFIAEGKKTEEATVYGGLLSLDDHRYFDSADGKEILYGEYLGEPRYLPAASDDMEQEGQKAKHRAGVERVDLDSIQFAQENAYAFEQLIYQEGNDCVSLGSIPGDTDYRIVLTVYLEGWDEDLTDRCASGKLAINISFLGVFDL